MRKSADSVTRRKAAAGVGGVKVSIIVPAKLHQRLERQAKAERRSLSQQGAMLIEQALDARAQVAVGMG